MAATPDYENSCSFSVIMLALYDSDGRAELRDIAWPHNASWYDLACLLRPVGIH